MLGLACRVFQVYTAYFLQQNRLDKPPWVGIGTGGRTATEEVTMVEEKRPARYVQSPSYRVHVHAIDATSSSANRFFLGRGLGGVHLPRPAGDELLEALPGRLRRPPLAVDLDAVHLVGLDEAPII